MREKIETLKELPELRQTSGYFSCCGRSKFRGHWEYCPSALTPSTEEKRG
jgi:hypothetical protein